MLAVGIWAAQMRGRAVWMLPLSFVGMMSLGGLAGAMGLSLPGVEIMILLSAIVFGVLVVRRIRVRTGVSVALVSLFAFFHGFAHGAEMPASGSLLWFALGFCLATLLLHGAGILSLRGAMLALAFVLPGTSVAQVPIASPSSTPEEESESGQTTTPRIIVLGRGDSLLGLADSAAQGTVGAAELQSRPILRAGEILETIPGVIITQHAGGGKANQYFLRGFNLDHGTDFATFLDGMPVNLPTHGHGQGYSDLNIVIPELVERINYQKGVYYPENGDFSSAGAAHLELFKTLPQTLAVVEGGMYGFARTVFASSPKIGQGNVLYGLELYHYDGPWENPDDYQKFNGIITYSQGNEANGLSLTVMGYHGKWDSSDQVAESAINDGLVPFYGSLDNTTGGNSQRYSLQAEWHRRDEQSATKVMAYGFYYDLDLFSNFTYFLTDTTLGDQFEQVDKRWVGGLDASHTFYNHWGDHFTENTFGLQLRNDWINNGLFNTEDRQRVDKINSADGSILPAVTRQDDIVQTSGGLYYQNTFVWTDKIRTIAGLRGDLYHYDVDSNVPQNSGSAAAAIASPKFTLILGPWADTEIYLQGGLGFHSNDGRGTTTHVDPVTGSAFDGDGNRIKPADPLVRTYGAEVGLRTTAVAGWQSTVSLWWLDVDSELLFVGDAGATEASRPSRRYGVEWGNYYQLTKSLTLDADISFSQAQFRDDDPAGDYIPGSIRTVIAAGITYQSKPGFFASARLRYFGPRPLIEDNSFRSEDTILVNAQVGYEFNQTWTVSAEVLNLLNQRDHDIDYAYESRVRPGADAVTQIHFHPVEPFQLRFGVTARF